MNDYLTLHINKVFAIRALVLALALGGAKLAYERGITAGINLAFSYMKDTAPPEKGSSSQQKEQSPSRLRKHSSDPTDKPYYFDEARRGA